MGKYNDLIECIFDVVRKCRNIFDRIWVKIRIVVKILISKEL